MWTAIVFAGMVLVLLVAIIIICIQNCKVKANQEKQDEKLAR
jgi:hypothetical protein